MKNIIEHEISQITKSILDDYGTGRNIDKMDLFNQPSKEEIIAIVEDLLKIVYPGYYRDRSYKIYNIKWMYFNVFNFVCSNTINSKKICKENI